MTFWLDAQLSPRLSRWLTATFGVNAIPVRDLGLRNSHIEVIF
jgi:predicted nuclease of predicted toxin-antitoxin system